MSGQPTGLSSQAIAYAGAKDHPHDPADLLRCMRFCDGYLTTEQLRDRMTGRSVYWDRLLPEWDNLVALLEYEMANSTNGKAPLTYFEMQRVLQDGIKCATCNGTGRGALCVKCKGTGNRSGGRCRAAGCYSGAAFCRDCRGRGFTPREI